MSGHNMLRRTFKIATTISWALLVTTFLLWIAAFWIDPWSHRISLGDNFHISVGGSDWWDVSLVVFNDAEYGPYRGSIIGFSDNEGHSFPKFDREIYYGDTWGVYYRYFRWLDQSVLWTLMVSLWYFIIVFSMLPLIA